MKYIKTQETYTKSYKTFGHKIYHIQQKNFNITEIGIYNFDVDVEITGWIDLNFYNNNDDYYESRRDHWRKTPEKFLLEYGYNYPPNMIKIIKKEINKYIEEEKIKRDANKYNL